MRKVRTQEPEGFAEFWEFWRETARHTDGRGKCRDAYARQIAYGATPEDILLAAQFHVRNTKDLAFIPLAATWLNAEKWVDEAPKERAYQQRLSEREQQRSANVVSISAPKSKWLQQFEAEKQQKQA